MLLNSGQIPVLINKVSGAKYFIYIGWIIDFWGLCGKFPLQASLLRRGTQNPEPGNLRGVVTMAEQNERRSLGP
jgi:hypothetical protein